ncbi:hypothetical protein BDD12DRAFT_19200 [Trichophaea hybrida]|nr:hypothetical protein BDD12DRAFT_19200 [Trichophaea hybrida]
MHGTYVNGLQLHLNETAELQQGTEVTFGAEVTRGDDVYPAKTFRCEVEWERMRSPSPRPDTVDSKSRSGYGLSSAELEYESNLEDEDFDAEMEEHSQDERLSASSGASSPLRSPSREKSCSASSLTTYLRREEIAESHERSTRESLKQLNKVFEAKSSKIKDLIDRDTHMIDLRTSEERPNKQEDNTRPRMPTIHSLVNKTQSDSLSHSRLCIWWISWVRTMTMKWRLSKSLLPSMPQSGRRAKPPGSQKPFVST